MSTVAFHTPLGQQLEIDEVYLPAVLSIVEAAHAHAYGEVLALLDTELDKSKDRGDSNVAEVVEVLRAKVKAKLVVS